MLRGIRSTAKYVWIVVFIAFVGGFLLFETSGLLGSDAISPATVVATVNGRDIVYVEWAQRLETMNLQQSQSMGRSLSGDELRLLEDRLLDEMILEILLDAEFRRRGITVTDEEILRTAEVMPHPEIVNLPELQTDGRFDPEKYLRYLSSPTTKAQGVLHFLEQYYRSEIPRLKLFEQLVAGNYVTDYETWESFRNQNDSAQVSFVAITPDAASDTVRESVSESEIRQYYENHRDSFSQIGRALVSLLRIPIIITAADTASARDLIATLRSEIVAGDDSAFQNVARRESNDTRTAPDGGTLPRAVKGQTFGAAFDSAAFALRPGQVSQPVLSPLGFHLVQLIERAADTAQFRHLLIEIRQSDSVTVVMDRRADSLTAIASNATDPAVFDSAAAMLRLTPSQQLVFEGQPLSVEGRSVPGVTAWAFSGALVGESSNLLDAPNGFYLARLDSVTYSGTQPLADVRDEIDARITRERQLERLRPRAAQLAARAVASDMETAAREGGLSVEKTQAFTRVTFVPGIGRQNRAIGAAFILPVGAISEPIATEDAIFVLRVDRRVTADREAWVTLRPMLRQQMTQEEQQEKVQTFLAGLRQKAKIVDKRRELAQMGRTAG